MDRIRAGNGPKSVQERGVQKTLVFVYSACLSCPFLVEREPRRGSAEHRAAALPN